MDSDPETGAWCAAHYDRGQLLSLASLVTWERLAVPGYGVVVPASVNALARNGTDEQRAWVVAALTREE